MRNLMFLMASSIMALSFAAAAAPGDPVFETCPESGDVGDNVACYPVTFTAKTEVHPDGIPIIGYLFVPTDHPGEPLPAIVFAHGSGSMYSRGHHNDGLNSKHKQWVRQYTSRLGYVSLHVSSFHSRYLLPDTPGDQRVMEIDAPPEGIPGGDDYRATSYEGSRDAITRIDVPFDPDPIDDETRWKDANNGGAGVSEVMERAYDMDAAWDFLAGIRPGAFIDNSRNEDEDEPTLGVPMVGNGYIGDIVTGGLTVDHERIFLYGTSHGGQAAMATAHMPRALDPDNPMNANLPDGFELRRFAGIFDFYGGCKMYGAFGGSDFDPGDPGDNSEWRPYGPFLILAGDRDDTVFDDDTIPVESGEQLANEACGKRIAAARADPAYDEFLEILVYDHTYHSFDGVESDDFTDHTDTNKGEFTDWLAKIHSNYRIVLPLMEAIGRQVSARRNSETVPTLAELGFSDRLPYFDTVPLVPRLGPQPTSGGALDLGTTITIDDLGGTQLDLMTLLDDPFDYFDISCEISDVVANITEPAECIIDFALTSDQLNADLPDWFWIRAYTSEGHAMIPAHLMHVGGDAGELSFGPAFYSIRPGEILASGHDGNVNIAVDGFVWSRFGSSITNYRQDAALATAIAGYSVDTPRILNGPVPAVSQGVTIDHFSAGNAIQSQLQIVNQGTDPLAVQLTAPVLGPLDDANFHTAVLPAADFATNFVALTPLDDEPGDDSGSDDSGSGGSGGNDSDSGGSGGGALLWLLPIALLIRKRT